MEATYKRGNSWFAILLILAAGILFAVTIGGKTFDQIVMTEHFQADHWEDCRAKEAALKPGAWWHWIYQCNENNELKYTVKVKTALGVVILVVIICAIKGKKTLKLITGYRE